MRSWRSSPPPWGMAARSATGFGLIGSPGWRSYGLSPPHCRRRSRCGSPNPKSPNNLLLMCTRPRLAVASPNKSVWLNTGRALWFELPDTYAQLSSGELSERVAETIVSETRHLDAEKRGEVDQQLKAVGVSKLGFKAATLCVRKITYEADRRGYVQRGRTERQHRRVGMRPAPDTMAVLTGYLPVEQGVACYTALQQHADATVATGDGRSWPARSWPPVGDVNGGAGSSPHPPPPQPALGRLWVGIRPGGTSTAG